MASSDACEQIPYSSLPDEEAGYEVADDFEARRPHPGGWKTMPFILANDAFERVATMGLTSNFLVYLLGHYNMPQLFALNVGSINVGCSSFAPLFGAFAADAFWGRYRTLAFGCIASTLGMLALTMTAVIPGLTPPRCGPEGGDCIQPNAAQLGFLFFALALLAIGSGGIRPCSLPFGLDQFDKSTDSGRQETGRYFNWYYFSVTLATVLAFTVVVYVQNDISWAWGFAIPTFLMLLATIVFFAGAKLYVYVPPDGSALSRILPVFVASFRKRSLELPPVGECDGDEVMVDAVLYNPTAKTATSSDLAVALTQEFSFLNRAAIVLPGEVSPVDGSVVDTWSLCSVQQVEDVKCLLRVVPIWVSGVVYMTVLSAQTSMAVLQAINMDRHLGRSFEIPPGSTVAFSQGALIVFLPIYDRVIVPVARRFTKREMGITLFQRLGAGIFLSLLAMEAAAAVETKRRDSALTPGSGPISVFWLCLPAGLMGIGEALNVVGQIEFYYRQFPEHMQSLGSSMIYLTIAGAGYINSLVMTLVQMATQVGGAPGWLADDVNLGRVDYYYYLIAAIAGLNLVYFMFATHFFNYKDFS